MIYWITYDLILWMFPSHNVSSGFSDFSLSFLLSGCYNLLFLFRQASATELSSNRKSAKHSSSYDNSLLSLFSSNIIWIDSSITKVLELYTLNAFDLSEYSRNVPQSLFESKFPRLSFVLRIEHLHPKE